jgi:DNA repair exonuclease SbcCD ATPase subunit
VNLESTPGLEAISILRVAAYERRTRANKEAKDAAAKVEQATAGLPTLEDGPSVGDARLTMETADRALERLHVQNANAEGARAALAGNRRRADERRARATAIRADLPMAVPVEEEEALAERWSAANAEIENLKSKLRSAEERAKACHEEAKRIAKAKEEIAKGEAEAKRLDAEAAELEGDVSAVEPVAPRILAEAEAALQGARAAHERAIVQEKARAQHDAADVHQRNAEAATAHAEKLDRIVDALTKRAPVELAAAGGGIPGLTIDDEGIALDGVPIDKRSGAEQLDLSVEIAKRCAGKARILLIDTLERLDGATRERFLRKATEGGWQVIGTCVRDGDVEYVAIEPGDDAGERSAAE